MVGKRARAGDARETPDETHDEVERQPDRPHVLGWCNDRQHVTDPPRTRKRGEPANLRVPCPGRVTWRGHEVVCGCDCHDTPRPLQA